jgi:hypothetical protein
MFHRKCRTNARLDGKTVVTGIGKETALDLVRRGKTTCNNCHWRRGKVDGVWCVEGGEDSAIFRGFPFHSHTAKMENHFSTWRDINIKRLSVRNGASCHLCSITAWLVYFLLNNSLLYDSSILGLYVVLKATKTTTIACVRRILKFSFMYCSWTIGSNPRQEIPSCIWT